MNLSDALIELGTLVGIPHLILDEDGFASVMFDEQFLVELQSLNGGKLLHLCAPITVVSLEDPEVPQLHAMLEANFIGCGRGGARFSIRSDDNDDQIGEAVFENTLPVESMNFADFSKSVEDFLNDLETWQTTFGDIKAPVGETV